MTTFLTLYEQNDIAEYIQLFADCILPSHVNH